MTIKRQDDATHELQDVEVFKVDLVGKPATGDTFLVVRSEDGGTKPIRRRRALLKETAVEALEANNSNPIPLMTIERAVPPADASPERKRKAQKARAEKYGIEALENKGENLSYPKGDPTTERLYGDSSNLKYPLGYDDNKLSPERANNARARFKQAYAVYTKTASRRVIHNRIVEAQLKAGANPSYNPDDPLDKLLSSELKKKLQKPVERNVDNTEETEMSAEKIAELKEAIERMQGLFSGVLGQISVSPEPTGETIETVADEPETPEEVQAQEETPEAQVQEAAPETPQEPQQQPIEVVDATVQAEAQMPVEPQPEPIQPDLSQIEALNASMTQMAQTIERMGKAFEGGLSGIQKSVEGLTGRVDRVERSVRSGGNSEEQEGTVIERGGNGVAPGLWSPIVGGIVKE